MPGPLGSKSAVPRKLPTTHITVGGILTGDATEKVEKDIIGRYEQVWLDCDVLKVGHHGSLTSTCQEWVDAVKPEVAIVTAGFYNGHGHPRSDVIQRLEDATVPDEPHRFRWAISRTEFENFDKYGEAIYSTATNDTIVVTSGGGDSFSVEYATRVRRNFDDN